MQAFEDFPYLACIPGLQQAIGGDAIPIVGNPCFWQECAVRAPASVRIIIPAAIS